jgi:hypothetical protein
MTGLLVALLAVALDGLVTEPATREAFPPTVQIDGTTAHLTGADHRAVSGIAVYAIAHYGALDSLPASDLNDAQTRWHWVEAQGAKAFVLLGVREVPARGIRYSWRNSLKRAGYTGDQGDAFVKAFTKDFGADSELRLTATADGTLRAEQDGELLGTWQDPELVRAVWLVSLGRDSEVRQPERLVTRQHLGLPPLSDLAS